MVLDLSTLGYLDDAWQHTVYYSDRTITCSAAFIGLAQLQVSRQYVSLMLSGLLASAIWLW